MATEILMPALSPTMEEGTLAKWLVKEGDTVNAGDLLAEIETDKATMEFEAVDEGTIGKILVSEGTEGVKVNTPIALIGEEGEDMSNAGPASPSAPADAGKEVAASGGSDAPAPAPAEAATAAPAAPVKDGTRIFASPLARRIAADKGLDLAQITGSGPHGRIIKADVETAQPQAAPAEAAPAAAEPA
uniref:biotin/lipoyl-containing protein n=1 Tax=Salibaculum halophilum TaxID=1914408 RepID=UPI00117B1A51